MLLSLGEVLAHQPSGNDYQHDSIEGVSPDCVTGHLPYQDFTFPISVNQDLSLVRSDLD